MENNEEKKVEEKEYEILKEDYPNSDLSFKVIIIGNSGKYNNNLFYNRCW